MPQKPVLLILERGQSQLDHAIISNLKQRLDHLFEDIVIHGHHMQKVRALIEPQPNTKNKLLQRLYLAINLIRHPFAVPYYFPKHKNDDIKYRCRNLRAHVNQLRKTNPRIVVLGRSIGARIATLMADELKIEKVICMGYPFKHPETADEPTRYQHLATINTPTIILQGINDDYGGAEAALIYKMSKNVLFTPVDTCHEFKANEAQWNEVCHEIEDFITEGRLQYLTA